MTRGAVEADPLWILLSEARQVGLEYCWPAAHILRIVDAFHKLAVLLLGAELWLFEESSGSPTVIGWTEFTGAETTWTKRVEDACRSATEQLIGHSTDQDLWINLTWLTRSEDD